MRIALYILAFLAAASGGVEFTAAHAQEARPGASVSREKDDEAFATYVAWASEELRRTSRFRLNVGLAEIPMGLLGQPETFAGFDDPEEPPSEVREESGLTSDRGVFGARFGMTLPAGFAYELHYGAGRAAADSSLFNELEGTLAADLGRLDVSRAYGGLLSWKTPLEGFMLKGGLSQVRLNAEAVTQASPLWSRAGVGAGTRGRIVNTSSSWRAGAEQRIGGLRLSAEYTQSLMSAGLAGGTPAEQVAEGYTGRAAYRVSDWLQFGSSYSLYYADRNDRRGETLQAMGRDPAEAWIRDIGLSARFDFNSRVALQLEGHLMNGLLGVAEDADDEDWRRFGARMMIQF